MDEKEILDKTKDLEEYYRNFHHQCAGEDTYYDLEFPILQVEGFTAHHPASARIAIDDAAAQIDTSSLQVEVPSRTSSAKHQEAAIRLRQFYLGAWRAVLEADDTLLHRAAKSMFQYGLACFKTVYDQQLWGDAPQRKRGENDEAFEERIVEWRGKMRHYFPHKVILVHPANVMPDPTIVSTPSAGCAYVIEKYRRKAADVAIRYPEWSEGRPQKKMNEFVDWIEYWDANEFWYICDKKKVVQGKHDYGFVPYEFCDAGLGYSSSDGAPEKRWRGLLHGVHDELQLEARLIYQMEAMIRIHAFGPKTLKITAPETTLQDAERVQKTWSFHPAAMNILPLGVDLDEPTFPNLPPEVMALLGVTQAGIEKATVARVARGERPVGAASGYMTAVLAGLARIKFGPALKSLCRALANINQNFVMLVESYMPNGITVWGYMDAESFDVTLKPEDINNYYVNTVKLSGIAPEEQSRLLHDGIALYQAGLTSKRYVQEKFLQMENPIEDDTQLLIERVLQSPDVMAMLTRALMQSQEVEERAEALVGPAGEALRTAEGAPMIPSIGTRGQPPSPFATAAPFERRAQGVRPTMPGSPEEINLMGRQMAAGGTPMSQRLGARLGPGV